MNGLSYQDLPKKPETTSENKNEKSSIEIPYFCSIAAVAQT